MKFRDTIFALKKIKRFDKSPSNKHTKHYYNVNPDLKSNDNFVTTGSNNKDDYFFIIQGKYTIVFACYLDLNSLSTMLTIYGLNDPKFRTESGFDSISICMNYPFDEILFIVNIIDSTCVNKLKLCIDYIKMIMKVSSIEIDFHALITEFKLANECSYKDDDIIPLKQLKNFDDDEFIHKISLIYDVKKDNFTEALAEVDSYEYFGNMRIDPLNKSAYKFIMLFPGYKEVYLKFDFIYIAYTDDSFKVIIPSNSNIAIFRQQYKILNDECRFLLTLFGFNEFKKLYSLLPKQFIEP